MNRRKLRNALRIALTLLAVGCSRAPSHPPAFSADWLDDRGQSIGDLEVRLRGTKAASADVVVAVAGIGKEQKLLGVPLTGGARWLFVHPLDGRPILTGDVVVGAGGGEVFALSSATGKLLWKHPLSGASLVSAGSDGRTTALVLSRATRSALWFVDREGNVSQQLETEKLLGVPAVLGGIAFVPWDSQYVSAIDTASGEEVARVVVREKVSRALTIGGELYFGEAAFVRFDHAIRLASGGGATRIVVPAREQAGTPRLFLPGAQSVPAAANAYDRVRLFARPAPRNEQPGLDANHFYATYIRLVLGFDAGGKLAWVHTHPKEIAGGEAVAQGLLLCDEDGSIDVLDARTGHAIRQASFGEPIQSCVVRADSYKAKPSISNRSLGEQIAEAVSSRETTLAIGQRLLLRELATLSDEGATKTLVDVASDSRAAPVLVSDARAALAKRRNGAPFMLASLGKHYDFLRDVLIGPPVGPIAEALASMKDTRAASLLTSHLLDPANSDEDVRSAGAALAVLATSAELPALRRFFAMYRAAATSEPVAHAVGSVAEAILRLDPKDGRALLELAVKDPMTVPSVSAHLEKLLASAKE